MTSYVGLNVGGQVYLTSSTTLTKDADCLFTKILNGAVPCKRDEPGNYVIDRSGDIFRHVLNFLRCGKLVLPVDFRELPLLECEAEYFQLRSLKTSIEELRELGPHRFIGLNVSGTVYETTGETLAREPDSLFTAMLSGEAPLPPRDSHGNFLFDRNSEIFSYVLDFLRSGHLTMPSPHFGWNELVSLAGEAEFFKLTSLREQIKTLSDLTSQSERSPNVIHLYYYSWDKYTAYGYPGDLSSMFSFACKFNDACHVRKSDGAEGVEKLGVVSFSLDESLAGETISYNSYDPSLGHEVVTLHPYPSNVQEVLSILRTLAVWPEFTLSEERVHEQCVKYIIQWDI